jgi:hypothetical protein
LPHRTVTKAFDEILVSEPSDASIGGLVATVSCMPSGKCGASRDEIFHVSYFFESPKVARYSSHQLFGLLITFNEAPEGSSCHLDWIIASGIEIMATEVVYYVM